MDLAGPVMRDSLRFEEGAAMAGDAPGSGVAWSEAAVARYLA